MRVLMWVVIWNEINPIIWFNSNLIVYDFAIFLCVLNHSCINISYSESYSRICCFYRRTFRIGLGILRGGCVSAATLTSSYRLEWEACERRGERFWLLSARTEQLGQHVFILIASRALLLFFPLTSPHYLFPLAFLSTLFHRFVLLIFYSFLLTAISVLSALYLIFPRYFSNFWYLSRSLLLELSPACLTRFGAPSQQPFNQVSLTIIKPYHSLIFLIS